jgi:hypothetical protein
VTSWREFTAAAGPLGDLARERLEPGAVLTLVGTLRADGWPRISPVEALVCDGELYLGMMWRSRKALDLRRDARCVVHSAVIHPAGGVADAAGTEGDLKIYGRAHEVHAADERERYCVALAAALDWRPSGDFHLFRVDVTQAGFVRAGPGAMMLRWRPGEPAPVAEPGPRGG